MRKATQADIPAMRAFLSAHIETSMFLLSNLLDHGVDETQAPHGTTFYLTEDSGALTGVFGVTNDGFLLCQSPQIDDGAAQDFAEALSGRSIQGMTGEARQVAVALQALPVPDDAWRVDRVEPLLTCDLDGVTAAGEVRVARDADVDMLVSWFADYMAETGFGGEGAALEKQATERSRAVVGSPKTRLLIENDVPVAMAGINARVGAVVQVGGVFVPQGLRGQGRGGAVTRSLLAEQKDHGATRAILFAASPAAEASYKRIGFTPCGGYQIALLSAPLTLAVLS
ncbi:GNAT family N-acetyltransferase [Sagittula sp. SSi028]|uniref:GNAT family N-acetyltransferase n=1 Tax=Sagittula sp. SSi028 TaxID=3400636 RepID=UPI003AF9503F